MAVTFNCKGKVLGFFSSLKFIKARGTPSLEYESRKNRLETAARMKVEFSDRLRDASWKLVKLLRRSRRIKAKLHLSI